MIKDTYPRIFGLLRLAACGRGDWRVGACCLAALLTFGCSSEEVLSPLGRTEQITAGDVTVRVDTGSLTLSLLRGDAVLLRFPADAFELGTIPAVDDTKNYDPYRLYVPNALYDVPTITWHHVTGIGIAEVTDSSLALDLTYDGGKQATLAVDVAQPGSFKAHLVPGTAGEPTAFFRLRPRASAQEGFYGLGEVFDDVNHRGKIRGMQLELMPELESTYNEAHVPIPFVIGTNGWGMFIESPYPGVFAVATSADDLIEAAFGTGVFSDQGLVFHLFGANHPLDVTRLYYDVTGYPSLPARWALGPWVWRDESQGQAEVESDLNTMRDLDLAATGYWIDRPYATGVNTFDFDPALFTDAQAMIDLGSALGYRMALWHTPYLDESDSSTQALRQEATANGYYPPVGGINLNNWGTPIDLTNPDAYSWWQDHIRLYTNMGIAGFKLDYGEDIVPGLTLERNQWQFADGSDERTMHGGFQRFYHRVYAETLPQEGGFLLCRGGTYGDQTNVSIVWPGDLDADFSRHGEHIDDGGGGYISVGGLPASIVAGLSLGPSGFPFYGSDTGGYRHSPPDKETFTRWFQQTALSTVMQIGTSSNNVAWEFGPETGFDDEMLSWYRIYTRLHLRLFPYIWTYAQNLAKDGRPIARALGLAYPELGVHPSDTYLLGDYLLVAPVVQRDQRKRDVVLPPGRWVDYWTGQIYDGDQTLTVDAPLGTLPLFLQEGGIVPMLRPTIDSISDTTDPARVDSYATTPGVLYARMVAGSASTFAVFDGSEVRQERLTASIALGWKAGAEFTSGAMFELIAVGGKPASVTSGGVPLTEHPSVVALEAAPDGWAYEASTGGTVWVKTGPGNADLQVDLP